MGKPITLNVLEDGAMYTSAAKIHPRETSGTLQRLRTAAVFWLLGMFYLFPWISWSGRQVVLFDLPARKFHVFGWTFWPQDFFYLAMLLMIAAFALFFFTALAGRLWCGYACPQTVWTEVFLWMERWTEGPRHRRIALDAAPWSADKLRRKGAKQLLWIGFALWTGFTFVGFFTPIRALGTDALHAEVSGWALFWILFYALATYGNAGYLREQVCKYMCPYARFQGAMFDRDTLIIAYDERRGEARGARRRTVPSVLAPNTPSTSGSIPVVDALLDSHAPPVIDRKPALGDCIDCTICVQVCPTGIDIRDGLQIECIACGACIDACDTVMDKLDYPRGLIRYSTLNSVQGRRGRVLRPRILIYSAILVVLVVGFAWSMGHRVPLIVDVLHDRNALYRLGADGSVENSYTLKVMNKDQRAHRYAVLIESPIPLAIATGQDEFDAGPEQLLERPLSLRAGPGVAPAVTTITVRLRSRTDDQVEYAQEARFLGPSDD